MVTVRGKSEVKKFISDIPIALNKILPGAGRAGGKVIAKEAKERSNSAAVADAVTVRTRPEPGRVVVRITVKSGFAHALGIWQEWGTDPHFISVDDSQREGRSVARINRLDKEAHKAGRQGPGDSLVINGKFVGSTVHHPGARPHPFLRPALDAKEGAAIAAAQAYINARVGPSGITATSEPEGDDE